MIIYLKKKKKIKNKKLFIIVNLKEIKIYL